MSLRQLWQTLTAPSPEPAKAKIESVLTVESAGLCCAVGYHLPAAACAIRARMDHFQESEFVSPLGKPVVVARLAGETIWGQDRLAQWIVHAMQDCLRHVPDLDTAAVPLIWLAPERERAGSDPAWYQTVFDRAVAQLDRRFHPASGVMPLGRAGLAAALQQAADWAAAGIAHRTLIVGADTYLDAGTINHYLHAERLLVDENSDGFIPGEAAAAVLIQASDPNETPSGLRLAGWGTGDEPGRVDGSVPCRSEGLSVAMEAALDRARLPFDNLSFRVSDQNGEAWFARDAAHAVTRVTPAGGPKLPVVTLADCLGEVGAATGPAMLAYLHQIRPRPGRAALHPGEHGLLHLANDNGLRSALVVSYSSTVTSGA